MASLCPLAIPDSERVKPTRKEQREKTDRTWILDDSSELLNQPA